MTYRACSRLLIIALAVLAGVSAGARAYAADTPTDATATVLTLSFTAPQAGLRAPFSAHLATADGAPVADALITFFVNDQRDGEARTDGTGTATWRLRTTLDAGTYTVTASFDGQHGLLAARAATAFGVGATMLDLQAVRMPDGGGQRTPVTAHLRLADGRPVPNAQVSFVVDGQHDGAATTNSQGIAQWRLRTDLAVGAHTIEAVFVGLPGYLAAQATTTFAVVATQIEISRTTSLSSIDKYPRYLIRLRSATGKPIANAHVQVLVDGTVEGSDVTTGDGSFTQRVKRDLRVGSHVIEAVFAGAPGFQATRASLRQAIANTAIGLRLAPELSQGGERAPVAIHLTTATGAPLAHARISILVNTVRDGQAMTDAQGNLVWRIKRTLDAGDYTLAVAFSGLPGFAAASATTQLTVVPASLALHVLPGSPPEVGRTFTVVAHLSTPAGDPVAGGRVAIVIGGVRHGEVRTNAAGDAHWTLPGTLDAGTTTIEGTFAGMPGLLSTHATMPLQIAPTIAEIRLVPPLAGIRFTLGATEFRSDAQGIARIAVQKAGIYRLTMLPIAPGPDSRTTLARWFDGAIDATRDIKLPMATPLQVGLNRSFLVTPAFGDSTDQRIDPTRIATLKLTSSDGSDTTIVANTPTWLQANHILREEHGLVERRVLYALQSVTIDGSNVVNEGQQRFYADTRAPWKIELLLFTTRFIVRDALFGTPIGTKILLTYPNGTVAKFALAGDATVAIGPLARGAYTVQAQAPGIAQPMPLALSRNQDVPLLVISYIDLAVMGLVSVAIAFGILLLGRPALLLLLRQPRRLWQRQPLPAAMAAAPTEGRMWRRIFDPMLLVALSLVLFGIFGLGMAGVEANARSRGAGAPPTPAVASSVAAARPAALPPLAEAKAPVAKPTTRPAVKPPAKPATKPATKAAVDAAAPLAATGPLSRHMAGPAVVQLQQRLRTLHYFDYAQNTGQFGQVTEQAVRQFQHDRGLPTTGTVDAATRDALNNCQQQCVRHAN